MLVANFEAYSTISDRHKYTANLYRDGNTYRISIGSRSNNPIWEYECNSPKEYLLFLERGMDTAWIPLTEHLRVGQYNFSSLGDAIKKLLDE